MKALYEKITIGEDYSMLVKHLRLPAFDAPWHYHPEYELTYIIRSSGKRFVGDHVSDFEAGDLVLVGANLPHFWRNDEEQPADAPAEAVVVQFTPLLNDGLLRAFPEANSLRQLLQRAQFGLRFSAAAVASVRTRLLAIEQHEGMNRVLELLAILNTLAADRDSRLLASDSYQLSASEAETERMKRVLDYILNHFRTEIRVEQIASVAGMAPAAFCRYFRKRTNKSFVEYLNELRISHARKLLTRDDLSVGQVGLECGFNNISHFHRQFKQQTGTTPLRYQATYRETQNSLRAALPALH